MNKHLKFIVAATPGHYQAAHRLLRDEQVEKQLLGFPTIMAWEGDTLIGLCGTRIINKMIVAGPLVVRTDRRRLFTIMRLAEAYEAAMKELGIESFILSVEHGSILQRGIERYYPDAEPYSTEGGYDHYVWKVKRDGHLSQRAGSLAGGEAASAEPS